MSLGASCDLNTGGVPPSMLLSSVGFAWFQFEVITLLLSAFFFPFKTQYWPHIYNIYMCITTLTYMSLLQPPGMTTINPLDPEREPISLNYMKLSIVDHF